MEGLLSPMRTRVSALVAVGYGRNAIEGDGQRVCVPVNVGRECPVLPGDNTILSVKHRWKGCGGFSLGFWMLV